MITYAVPPLAVTLGALALHEQIDARLLVGGAFIMGGIALVNLGPFWRRRPFATPKEIVPQEQRV